jgi:glycosyltransferase involved in cell wall biosynthesis
MSLDNTPLISIIVPCYNYGNFLTDCLNSVLSQKYSNWECIIVDNASTDNTKNISELFVSQDSRFKYTYLIKKGVSAARNSGIQNSSGKYILPLDADDKIGADYIFEAVAILEKEPLLKVVYCEAMLFGEVAKKWDLPPFSMKKFLMENIVFCASVFRRSDYDATPGFNEEMDIGFEDWDFWLYMLQKEEQIYQIPKIHFYYRIRTSSRNNQLDDAKQKLLRKKIYTHHKNLYEQHLNFSDLIFDLNSANNQLKTDQIELVALKNDFQKFEKMKSYKLFKQAEIIHNFLKKVFKL